MRGSGPGGLGGAPTGWSGGHSRGPPWGPTGLLGYCFNGLCTTISTCFYILCCCWLLQDCFRGPAGPAAPYQPLAPPGPPPSLPFGSQGGPPTGGPFEPPGPPGPPRLW